MPSGEAVLTKPEVATYSRCLAKAIPANTNEVLHAQPSVVAKKPAIS